ncbi:DNA recombinase [Acetobacter senegalensis]|uniref:DNA recombinase n=1 Tax=Acetobacter senegalensis TaxID=446692 RepID=A0A252EHM8_9PROT|nr:tyrosine-type recombinase/integrase [Acetobacter senegalensis]OUL65958.1 DNA recombinase [Acetobacter senegalensis]
MVSGDQPRSAAPAAPDDGLNRADIPLVKTWLHNRSNHTVRAYRADVAAFARFVAKPMADVVLEDLQVWHDSMGDASDSTRRRKLSAVKSLLTYGHKLDFLPHDAGMAFRLERGRDSLNERILTRPQVLAMIAGEADPRRHGLLALLYGTGVRLSEACALRWRDMTRRQSGGIATVFGKGGKTRHVQVAASLWKELVALRVDDGPDTPVVPGHDGGPLHIRAAHRVVKRAAKRAGLAPDASAHWLRHAFASHQLDAGQNVHWVQAQLGHSSLATTTRYSHASADTVGADLLA